MDAEEIVLVAAPPEVEVETRGKMEGVCCALWAG